MSVELLEVSKKSKKKFALGAFNVFNYMTARAVVNASDMLDLPVIIQMSTPTVKAFGIKNAILLVKSAAEGSKHPVTLHLDHCTDMEFAKKCVDEGFKSIMFDGSELSNEDNIAKTREMVDYCAGKGVLVEGEVGVISGVEDDIVSETSRLATYDEVAHYIRETGVNSIAPSIGTAHGVYQGTPEINYDLIRELSDSIDCPVVVHGGTGLTEQDYKKLVEYGASKINISTAIKQAYLSAVNSAVLEEPTDKPMEFDKRIIGRVTEEVCKYMKYFEL